MDSYDPNCGIEMDCEEVNNDESVFQTYLCKGNREVEVTDQGDMYIIKNNTDLLDGEDVTEPVEKIKDTCSFKCSEEEKESSDEENDGDDKDWTGSDTVSSSSDGSSSSSDDQDFTDDEMGRELADLTGKSKACKKKNFQTGTSFPFLSKKKKRQTKSGFPVDGGKSNECNKKITVWRIGPDAQVLYGETIITDEKNVQTVMKNLKDFNRKGKTSPTALNMTKMDVKQSTTEMLPGRIIKIQNVLKTQKKATNADSVVMKANTNQFSADSIHVKEEEKLADLTESGSGLINSAKATQTVNALKNLLLKSQTGGKVDIAPNTGKSQTGGKVDIAPKTGKSQTGGKVDTAPNTGKSQTGGKVDTAPNTGKSQTGGKADTAPNTGKSRIGGKADTAPNTGKSQTGGKVDTAPKTSKSQTGGKVDTAPNTGKSRIGGKADTAPNTGKSRIGGKVETSSDGLKPEDEHYCNLAMKQKPSDEYKLCDVAFKKEPKDDLELYNHTPVLPHSKDDTLSHRNVCNKQEPEGDLAPHSHVTFKQEPKDDLELVSNVTVQEKPKDDLEPHGYVAIEQEPKDDCELESYVGFQQKTTYDIQIYSYLAIQNDHNYSLKCDPCIKQETHDDVHDKALDKGTAASTQTIPECDTSCGSPVGSESDTKSVSSLSIPSHPSHQHLKRGKSSETNSCLEQRVSKSLKLDSSTTPQPTVKELLQSQSYFIDKVPSSQFTEESRSVTIVTPASSYSTAKRTSLLTKRITIAKSLSTGKIISSVSGKLFDTDNRTQSKKTLYKKNLKNDEHTISCPLCNLNFPSVSEMAKHCAVHYVYRSKTKK